MLISLPPVTCFPQEVDLHVTSSAAPTCRQVRLLAETRKPENHHNLLFFHRYLET